MTNPIHENKERFNRRVEGIRNHPDLSEEAKRRYLGEAYAEAKAEHDRLVTEHKGKQAKNIRNLEREVFHLDFPLGTTTQEKELVRMSYRDGFDRAERVLREVKNPQERERTLTELLERAERQGDTQQADAIYHLARERGMWNVADAYLKERPKAKERWEKYATARQEAESLENRLFGWAPPREPHELGSGPRVRGERIHEVGRVEGEADEASQAVPGV